MLRYASAGGRNGGLDAINEFKHLIKEAHKRGIEVKFFPFFYLNYFCKFDDLSFLIQNFTGAYGCDFQSHS